MDRAVDLIKALAAQKDTGEEFPPEQKRFYEGYLAHHKDSAPPLTINEYVSLRFDLDKTMAAIFDNDPGWRKLSQPRC